MDYIVVVVRGGNADLQQISVQVRPDDHGEVWLNRCGDCGDSIVDPMADVIVGDAVPTSTREYLHDDNVSCRHRRLQPNHSSRLPNRSSSCNNLLALRTETDQSAPMELDSFFLLALGALLLTACGSSAAKPTTTSPAPTTVAQSITSVGASTTVRPGEPWMVYQRFTNNGAFLLDLRLVRPDGTGDHPLLTERPGNQTHPDWSPDGKRIVYTVDETQLWIANADGTTPTKLPIECSKPCDLIDDAAWSPDGAGHRVHARRGAAGQARLRPRPSHPSRRQHRSHGVHAAAAAGHGPPSLGAQRQVDRARAQPIRQRRGAGPNGSAVATIDATNPSATPVLLTDWSMFAAYPDWSWANNSIVFSTYDLGRRDAGDIADPSPPSDLYTVKPDGTGLTQLTHNPSGTTLIRNKTASGPLSTQPTWSPDGATIFLVQVDGDTWPGWSMAAMGADGANLRPAIGGHLMVGTHPRLRPVS